MCVTEKSQYYKNITIHITHAYPVYPLAFPRISSALILIQYFKLNSDKIYWHLYCLLLHNWSSEPINIECNKAPMHPVMSISLRYPPNYRPLIDPVLSYRQTDYHRRR